MPVSAPPHATFLVAALLRWDSEPPSLPGSQKHAHTYMYCEPVQVCCAHIHTHILTVPIHGSAEYSHIHVHTTRPLSSRTLMLSGTKSG